MQCFSKRQSNGSKKSEQYLIVQNKNNSIFTTGFFFNKDFALRSAALKCEMFRLGH